MVTVHLGGPLEVLGGPYELEVSSVAETVRCLTANFKEARGIIEANDWHIVMHDPETGISLGVDQTEMMLGDRCKQLHFLPVLEGGKGNVKMIMKLVIGAALIAASFVIAGPALAFGTSAIFGLTTAGNIALFGASLLLGGISGLLSPVPKSDYSKRDTPKQQASFLFQNGPVNLIEQGVPVPLVYGIFYVGSVSISAGLVTEQIAV